MLFVNEVHQLSGTSGAAFEELLRCQWAPALARDDDVRLVWCARSLPGAVSGPEIVTWTAVADGAALQRLGERIRHGDLREGATALGAARRAVARRVASQLNFSTLDVDLALIPGGPEPHREQGDLYVHDFVLPQPGMQREFETKLAEVHAFMREFAELGTQLWACFETVIGGGTQPENIMVSQVANAEALTRMLTMEIPREAVVPGMWMVDGLKVRDTWTSRLMRSVPWSPIG
ncbi:Uncharacterised protein [Mycolicibacterium vanbaalenii]|uniref:Uncharacterized protein n=1 Tax=Mycolicibacterium vanbaalenii TaxID=110539 RepID=A0A5S9QZE7_MYCVN|nr:Uncharacterised protein [Mycolicibacterium vanbaalenii]